MAYENSAAQGDACASTARPSTDQILDALESLFRKARGLEPDAQMALISATSACITATIQGVDTLELAIALAGGNFDGAVGHLFDSVIDHSGEELASDTDFALGRLLETVRPAVRANLVEHLHNWLTDDEAATLANSIRHAAPLSSEAAV